MRAQFSNSSPPEKNFHVVKMLAGAGRKAAWRLAGLVEAGRDNRDASAPGRVLGAKGRVGGENADGLSRREKPFNRSGAPARRG